MKHSVLAIALATALTLPQSALVQAADTSTATSQSQPVGGYLGVTIGRLPDSVRAQLPTTIPAQQGILVEQVMEDSPAAKAGLQPFDILLQYNDQKLFSPEQLTRLVGSDTRGQPVELTLVRGGQISTLQVTLAESHLPQSAQRRSRPELPSLPFHGHPWRPFPGSGQRALQAAEGSWESFDSLSLEKLNGDQYKAAIGYLAKDGTHKRLDFQGTRQEIRQQILTQKDLPDKERDQLLDALSSRDDVFPFHDWPPMPPERGFPPAPWWGWYPDL
jgi:hypothetical protein